MMSKKLVMAALMICGLGAIVVVQQAGDDSGTARRDRARSGAPETATESGGGSAGDEASAEAPESGAETGVGGVGAADATPSDAPRGSTKGKHKGRGGSRRAVASAKVLGPPPGPGIVAGVVRLAGGEAPLGVKVKLLRSTPGARETETNGEGRFEFGALEPGSYRLDVRHDGYARKSIFFAIEADEGAGTFDILLRKGGRLKVRVLGAHDAPLQGEKILLEGMGDLRSVRTRVDTDHEGTALFDHLPAGGYFVYRNNKDHVRTADVIPDKTGEVVFRVGCALYGTILGHDGEPIANARLYLTPAHFGPEGYRSVQCVTGPQGEYRLEGFPAGEYDLLVTALEKGAGNAYRSLNMPGGRVRVLDGQVLEFPVRLQGGSITGRITRAKDGEPFRLSGRTAQVQAVPVELGEDGKVKRTTGKTLLALSDKNGGYVFRALPPSVYRLWAPNPEPGYRDAVKLVDLRGGGELVVDIALESVALGTLRITVLEPDGSPASGVAFWLVDPKNGWTRNLFPIRMAEGVYDLRLEVGERILKVSRKGFVEPRLVVAVPAKGRAEREVKLAPAEENGEGG